MQQSPHLFCFGFGFSASILANQQALKGWNISGTYRTQKTQQAIEHIGGTSFTYSDTIALPESTTHILISIPPNDNGDIIFNDYLEQIETLPSLQWIGYFSTTGVYGDHQGNWVTEDTPPTPITDPAKRRAIAEQQWLKTALPLHIFRLAGIYGPGRNAFEQLRNGTARRIKKKGQVFSRIHVEDIAQIVTASMDNPAPGNIYNCADDLPEAQEKVIAYAAECLNITAPPLIPFEQADISLMAKNFYSCNRRIRNQKIKDALNVVLKYPDYKMGLSHLIKSFTL